jgi:DNA-binding MarR family transcriptional regulator
MYLKILTKERRMRFEAEMIPPLKSFLIEELYMDALEEEFTAGYGIADIVGIKYNPHKLKARIDSGFEPVTNIRELSILTLLQKNNPSSSDDLAKKIGLSVSYVKKTLLKSLIEKGYIERKANEYILVRDVSALTDLVVSVEAKLTKWKDALAQAKRYQHFSNIVFVALPVYTVRKIDKELFKRNNIGVLAIESDSVIIELEPERMKPKTPVMHLYCNEMFFEKQKALR